MTQVVFSFLFFPLSKLPAGALELENQLAALLIVASFGQINREGKERREEGTKEVKKEKDINKFDYESSHLCFKHGYFTLGSSHFTSSWSAGSS